MRTIADTRAHGHGSRPTCRPARVSTEQDIVTWQVSTTDETRRQISKPEQPNGPPYVSLQYNKVSCRRTHSCRSKTLKHAALLKHASRCKQRKHCIQYIHFTYIVYQILDLKVKVKWIFLYLTLTSLAFHTLKQLKHSLNMSQIDVIQKCDQLHTCSITYCVDWHLLFQGVRIW